MQGWAPFQRGTTAATVHAILYETPSLESCPAPLHQVISGLLVRQVEQRLSAGTVRALLDGDDTECTRVVAADAPTGVVDSETSVVRNTPARPSWHELPGDFGEQESSSRSRRRSVLVAVPVVLAVVIGLGVVFLLRPGTTTGTASALVSTTVSTTAATAPAQRTTASTTTTTTVTTTTRSKQATSATALPTARQAPEPTRRQRVSRQTMPAPAPDPPATQQTTGEPAPETTTSKPDWQLVRIVRYYHPAEAHFTATSEVRPPPEFNREWTLGYLVANHVPGTKKLYACKVPGQMDYFSSTDPSGNCEGQKTLGVLGYIFVAPPEGVPTRPLYRCNAGADHFDSIKSNCEGETFELMHGYIIVK